MKTEKVTYLDSRESRYKKILPKDRERLKSVGILR